MKSAVRLGAIILCLNVLLMLISCSDDGNGSLQGSPVGAACTDNSNCETNLCLQDTSFPGSYCTMDCSGEAPCPPATACHEYQGYMFCMASCSADESCRDGYLCNYDVCRPACTSNKVCQGTDQCFNGHCKMGCEGQQDCEQDMRCQDGKCVPPCKTDNDCLPGYACDATSGECTAKPGKKMGEACTSSSQCATDYCMQARHICSAQCTSTARCPSDYVCGLERLDLDNNGVLDSAGGACIPKQGPGIAGSSCSADADCASDHCYSGFCMEACKSDGDCSAMQCVTVNILLKAAIPTYQGCLPRKGTSTFPLGTFPAAALEYHGFDIPPNASSFILTTEVQSISEAGAVMQITDPDGKVLTSTADYSDPCKYYSQLNRYYPLEQIASLFVPNTQAVQLVPGIYTYMVGSTNPSLDITVKLHLKLGRADTGTLNINWFFLNLADHDCIPGPTLNAASAPTHSWLGQVRNNMAAILQKAGLKIANETFHDVNDPTLDVIDMSGTGTSNEIKKLYSKTNGMQGKAINFFIVRNIEDASMGGIVLGHGGAIPGPPAMHGTIQSGAMMSGMTACFQNEMGLNPAHTAAHEICHHLGLFHNQESDYNPGYQDNQVICPCPCGPNMSCRYGFSNKWCQGEDHIPDTTNSPLNLMFWAAESTEMFEGNNLTPGQIRVLLDNPLVGH